MGLSPPGCCSLCRTFGGRWRRGWRGVRSGLLFISLSLGGSFLLGLDITRSVADRCVEWGPNDGDIILLLWLDETFDRLEMGKAGNAGEGPLPNC